MLKPTSRLHGAHFNSLTLLAVTLAQAIALLGCAQSEQERAPRGPAQVAMSDMVVKPTAAPPATPPAPDATNQPTLLVPTPPPGGLESMTDAAAAVCKSNNAQAEKVEVDVVMMIDQSLSMIGTDEAGVTRWDNVISALTQFIQAPESAGLNIGVQYFGLGLAGGSCEPADYVAPEVEVGKLPGNAAALTASFAAHGPSSVTPTAPALQGAIRHARDYHGLNPAHAVIVLLVTDGEPDACGLLPDTVAAAQEGLAGTPSITTYVLGVGTALDALHQIAAAGGSGQAHIVDATKDVSAQIVAALSAIRGSAALPCEFLIPPPDPGSSFELDKVNLTFTPSSGDSMLVGYASDPADCDRAALGWHYDDPAAPTKFMLCKHTCETVASSGGRIDIALKCPTIDLK